MQPDHQEVEVGASTKPDRQQVEHNRERQHVEGYVEPGPSTNK